MSSATPRPADPVAAAVDCGPIIEARGLTKRFGSYLALDRVDLDLARGASLALFGPNGAGKTTLIRILASGLRATAGSLRVAGLDPAVHGRDTRRIIGIVSHETHLYDDLSALENLLFFARLYGAPAPSERARALLDLLGLTDRAEDPVRTFSRGMQQRLALARAMVHDPAILFLDEPFTGLDPRAVSRLLDTLLGFRQSGRTLVVATHDLARGLDLSDRWIILARGRAIVQGCSAEAESSAFETTYFEHLGGLPTGVRA